MSVMEPETADGGHTLTQNLFDLGKQLLEKAKNGKADEVRALMSGGAPFTADWLGTSPLHMAAASGHVEICEILLRAGCSRDARTKVDKTPLHLAAYEGHGEVVDLLLRYGATIDATDMLLMTPLHWAVEKGHTEVARILLHRGASTEINSKFDLTPMDIAVQCQRKEIVDLLQEFPVSPVAIDNAVASLFAPSMAPTTSEKAPQITVAMGPKFATRKATVKNVKVVGQRVINLGHTSPPTKDPVLSDLEILEQAACNGQVTEDALQFLQTQGIHVQESALQDDGSIVATALEAGATISLSDAGRLALGKTDPGAQIILVDPSGSEDRKKLQQELEKVRQEAEAYKRAFKEKAREADEYKKRLKLSESENILGGSNGDF